MGRTARLGVFGLMALAIALARLVEVELQPERLVVETPAAIEAAALPPVEIDAEPAAEQEQAAPASVAAAPAERFYEVRPGDTLDRISQKVYGSRRYWRRLQEANRDVIPKPEKMRPGIKLRIPPLETEPSDSSRVGRNP